MNSTAAAYKLSQTGRTLLFQPIGDWTLAQAGLIDPDLSRELAAMDYDRVEYDFSMLSWDVHPMKDDNGMMRSLALAKPQNGFL